MKKFFSKDNFILSGFDSKQRLQSLIVSCGLIFFFVLASLTFFNALYAFADFVGSIVSGSADVAIKDITRSLPLLLTCFMSIWALLLFHACFRNTEGRLVKSLKKDAICLLAFAGANLLAIIVMLIMGKFHSLVEGAPSALYPLDSILFSLIFVALGVFVLVYLSKLQEKMPYLVPARGPIVKKARGAYCTFVTFWLLVALFSFSGFFLGLFIQDFKHGYLFFSLALLFVFLVNILFIGMWELYYNQLKEEKKREFLLPLALCGLCVSVLAMVLYFVGLGLNLDGPSNAGFGILPVAFSASVNIATLIVVATPFIVSVVALIKGLVFRKKAK